MKRIVFLAGLYIHCLCISAQSMYQLWSIENGNAYVNNEAIKRGTMLEEDAVVCVDSGASLTFIDNEKIVYKYAAAESKNAISENSRKICLRVKNMINKKPNSLIKMISMLIDDAVKSRKHKTIKYLIPGGLERGQAVDKTHLSIYLSLREIAESVYNNDSLTYSQDIALLKTTDGDVCTFAIENRSLKQDYVVNILAVDATNKTATLCLQFPAFSTEKYVLAPVNTRIVIEETLFAENEDIHYFVFATTDAYDSSIIQSLLLDTDYLPTRVDPYSGMLLQKACTTEK